MGVASRAKASRSVAIALNMLRLGIWMCREMHSCHSCDLLMLSTRDWVRLSYLLSFAPFLLLPTRQWAVACATMARTMVTISHLNAHQCALPNLPHFFDPKSLLCVSLCVCRYFAFEILRLLLASFLFFFWQSVFCFFDKSIIAS